VELTNSVEVFRHKHFLEGYTNLSTGIQYFNFLLYNQESSKTATKDLNLVEPQINSKHVKQNYIPDS